MFRLRSTGGRYAVVGLALDPAQIVLPDSLGGILTNCQRIMRLRDLRWMGTDGCPLRGKERLRSKVYHKKKAPSHHDWALL